MLFLLIKLVSKIPPMAIAPGGGDPPTLPGMPRFSASSFRVADLPFIRGKY